MSGVPKKWKEKLNNLAFWMKLYANVTVWMTDLHRSSLVQVQNPPGMSTRSLPPHWCRFHFHMGFLWSTRQYLKKKNGGTGELKQTDHLCIVWNLKALIRSFNVTSIIDQAALYSGVTGPRKIASSLSYTKDWFSWCILERSQSWSFVETNFTTIDFSITVKHDKYSKFPALLPWF